MPDQADELEQLIDTMSAAVELPIPATCRPGVRNFLAIAQEMATALEAVPLQADELALAPVYTPPERQD